MNLQCAFLHLALVASPPAPAANPIKDESAPKAANDNHPIWPLLPFPEGWCATN